MGSVKYLLNYTWKKRKSLIFFSILYQLIYALLPLGNIILPSRILDELTRGKRTEYLIFYVAFLVLLNSIGSILLSTINSRCFILKGSLFVDFQATLTENLATCDFERLESPDFLDIKEKAKKFIFADGQGFGVVLDHLFGLLGKLLVFGGIIAVVARLNVIILSLLVCLVLLNSYLDAKLKKKYVEMDLKKTPIERRTNYLISIIENIKFGKEVRLYGIQAWLTDKVKYYLNKAQDFYKGQMKLNLRGQHLASISKLLSETATYIYLINRTLLGVITIGDFTMYVSAVANFNNAMKDFMGSILEIRRFSGYYSALSDYINIPARMREGKNAHAPKKVNEIVFDHVSFQYPGQKAYALKNINIKIAAAEKISVVGENGAGKTTFIKLLCRMYDPTEGKILLNGTDIRDIRYDEYQQLLSAVFQDYQLFSFSLKENIVFDHAETDEVVEALLLKSGFDPNNKKRAAGVNTFVYKDFEASGFEPSGGEGQKIALARALYKDAPIVILDEPTAALDPRAEHDLYQKFNSLVHEKMAVFVSHRLSSSKFCDRIIVFENGTIAECGTHYELLEKKGIYNELYGLQAQFYESVTPENTVKA